MLRAYSSSTQRRTSRRKAGAAMSQRETNLLWLKDLLEHLTASQQQLTWSEHPETVRLLLENMIRDLDCCRRLCETIRRRPPERVAV
jgi:hypothetical protein